MATDGKPTRVGIAGVLVIIGVLAFIGWGLWLAYHPAPVPLQGQVEAQSINISPKISARIEKIVQKADGTVTGTVPFDSPDD